MVARPAVVRSRPAPPSGPPTVIAWPGVPGITKSAPVPASEPLGPARARPLPISASVPLPKFSGAPVGSCMDNNPVPAFKVTLSPVRPLEKSVVSQAPPVVVTITFWPVVVPGFRVAIVRFWARW